ncbi:MAG: UDP-N-acetylmuramoyl-L-alanyl-D-glutamate--2,6-diaminopimelate ligase [Clostridia bacterium]|nr:UDP-N-acetylmuramoyl-L-alanyl-D-glutamate--2,6-diaminopimelate ligase [Clostridia bacterium]
MKLSRVLSGVAETERDIDVTNVCYNSRFACPGSVFVAVKGYTTDGHKFIGKAVENGASVVIAEHETPGIDAVQIIVDNSRRALALTSANFFGNPEREMNFIGVTGTNGKTTSTTLIKQILEKAGHKCGLIGTNGNMIGDRLIDTERTTPESRDLYELLYEMKKDGCDYVVMEVSSHSLVLDRVAGIHFKTAVFTNLTQDHLDFHGDMESYFEAKKLLFSRCDKAVINVDDPYGKRLAEEVKCEKLTVSAKVDHADLVAKNILLKPSEVRFEAVMTGKINRVSLKIPGMFSVYNALSALGASLCSGLTLSDTADSLASAHGVKGRAEVVPVPEDRGFTVLIDYAHSPDGMENILRTVKGFTKGRLISVFGAGGNRDKTKRPKMGKIGSDFSDICVITSDNPRKEEPMSIIAEVAAGTAGKKCKVMIVEDRRKAIRKALSTAKKDDVVLLLGKGHETYQEIATGKIHLDEREEIAAYFSE